MNNVFSTVYSPRSHSSKTSHEKSVLSTVHSPRSHSQVKLPTVFMQTPCWHIPGIIRHSSISRVVPKLKRRLISFSVSRFKEKLRLNSLRVKPPPSFCHQNVFTTSLHFRDHLEFRHTCHRIHYHSGRSGATHLLIL